MSSLGKAGSRWQKLFFFNICLQHFNYIEDRREEIRAWAENYGEKFGPEQPENSEILEESSSFQPYLHKSSEAREASQDLVDCGFMQADRCIEGIGDSRV